MKNKNAKKTKMQKISREVMISGLISLFLLGCAEQIPTNSPPTITANYNPSTGNVDIIGIDTDGDMAQVDVVVPSGPTIDFFISSNYTPNVGVDATLSATSSDGTIVGFEHVDADDDFNDGTTVNYSTFGKKIAKVKANNVAGDTIQSIDLYVQGNFDFSLDASFVEHDHDDSTIDTFATISNANGTYDTVKFYADGIEIESYSSGSTYNLKKVDWVGTKDITAKLFENGQEVAVSNIAQSLEGLNTPADHPECTENYGPDDDYIQNDAGIMLTYYLDRKDVNGDILDVANLITSFGVVTEPRTLDDFTVSLFGDYYAVQVDTTGWASGDYNVKHKINDGYEDSTQENISIRIN